MPRSLAGFALLLLIPLAAGGQGAKEALEELGDVLYPSRGAAALLDDAARKKAEEIIGKRLVRVADLLAALSRHQEGLADAPGDSNAGRVWQLLLKRATEAVRKTLRDGDGPARRAALLLVMSTPSRQESGMGGRPSKPSSHPLSALSKDVAALFEREKDGTVRLACLKAASLLADEVGPLAGMLRAAFKEEKAESRLGAAEAMGFLLFPDPSGPHNASLPRAAVLAACLPLLKAAAGDEAEAVRVSAFGTLGRAARVVLREVDMRYFEEDNPPEKKAPDEKRSPEKGPDFAALYDIALAPVRTALARKGASRAELLSALSALEKAATARRGPGDHPRSMPEFAKKVTAPVKAVPDLIRLLDHADLRLRLGSIHVLETLGKDAAPAAERLIGLLPDKEKFLRWGAARALRNMAPAGGAAAVKALTAAIGDDDRGTRVAAIQALGRFGVAARDAIGPLEKAITHADARTRVAALRALAALGKESAPASAGMVRALGDEQADVRAAAATALGRTGKRDAALREALAKALDDEDAQVRKAAAEALLEGE